MEFLLNGVRDFHENYFARERELFEQLAGGQQPSALFITCADSRIDPNLLTRTRPGELFVLRNAGNIVPPYDGRANGEGATIEYAVAALGIREIIVCGHTDCGAMKAVLDDAPLDALPTVASWLSPIEPLKHGLHGESAATDAAATPLDSLIEKNVLLQLDNLRTHPSVAARLERDEIRLHGWVYQIHKGRVLVHDERSSGFISPLTERATATERATTAQV